jgi:protein SCO1/2
MVPPRPRRRIVGLLLAVALGPLLAACGGGDDAPSELAGIVRAPLLSVGDVTLPDASAGGEPMAMRAPAGELLIVYFGYTSCPDICPTTMSDLSVAINDLPPALRDRVTVAMTTVDPERDNTDVLSGYLAHFFDRAIPLRTDDPAALAAAAEAFGVQFEVAAHDTGQTYAVAHSAITYVVDDTGTVAVEWPFGFDTEDMTADLTHLLTKENP